MAMIIALFSGRAIPITFPDAYGVAPVLMGFFIFVSHMPLPSLGSVRKPCWKPDKAGISAYYKFTPFCIHPFMLKRAYEGNHMKRADAPPLECNNALLACPSAWLGSLELLLTCHTRDILTYHLLLLPPPSCSVLQAWPHGSARLLYWHKQIG
jgi:hypothetical protein